MKEPYFHFFLKRQLSYFPPNNIVHESQSTCLCVCWNIWVDPTPCIYVYMHETWWKQGSSGRCHLMIMMMTAAAVLPLASSWQCLFLSIIMKLDGGKEAVRSKKLFFSIALSFTFPSSHKVVNVDKKRKERRGKKSLSIPDSLRTRLKDLSLSPC